MTERSAFPELAPSVHRAVVALRIALGLGSGTQDDLMSDTAKLVAGLYDSVLPGADTNVLRRLVNDLAARQEDAMGVLGERYRRYGSAGAGEVGRGPAVEAGAVPEAEWRNVAARLTDPVASAVRAIAEFA